MWRISIYSIGRRVVNILVPARVSGSTLGKRVISRIDQLWTESLLENLGEDVTTRIEGGTLRIPKRYVPHYVMQEYEPVTKRAILNALTPGMVVVDVGAHIGYFTILASRRVGPSGHVHAVEPSEENLRYLRENIQQNGLTNVTVHPVAAGAVHRKREFHITEASDSHGFYEHPYAETTRTVELDEVPLSELVTTQVDVLKVDVEGAEIEVLQGMESMLERNRAITLCVEWNPACMKSSGRNPLDLPASMNALGFERIEVLDDLNGTLASLDELSALVESDVLPDFWYVNLCATRM